MSTADWSNAPHATNTAMPQPNVITIQPEPLPLSSATRTFATNAVAKQHQQSRADEFR